MTQIEKTHQFRWKEDILVPGDVSIYPSVKLNFKKSPMHCLSESEKSLQKKLQHYFNHTNTFIHKMAIHYIDRDVGWGVMAKEEMSQCGDVISFYAGKITECYSLYNMHLYVNQMDDTVDAFELGNISRFMMHLPKEEVIIDLPDIDPEKIAKANCQITYLPVNEFRIPAFVQIKPIKPLEVIGYSYGHKYWYGRSSFWLVDKNGKKLAEVKYVSPKKIVAV